MEETSIRDFELQDFDGLSEVWSLTNLGNPQRGDNLDIILQSISMGGKMLVAVNADDRVIGTSWMTFDGRRIHLHHFGVHPDYQRKGIGKLLVKESLQFVKQKGYQVKLEVHQSNIAAINLYKQFGFTFLGDYDVYIIRDLSSIG
ncbi:MAG TPA: GNAT family N-acetyltransferase [Tenuifilaceae bacterium]|nr:GNAT family N-acetyltransferase [Tenuifilaceae bacterium]HOZ15728.1 GNAT family N-acetyltransferase [Tenuifilaceae bacterium]HPI44870.1 GNAT family N-acetyltransferase [Tenuifilaceae bacterium]HPN21010.1 GNAT family N-acetyltransferase [Tenuifilaceae bacterium]HPV57524.1 GNAT family N-acetyltransferase [Tenuifilaceae bacterium]